MAKSPNLGERLHFGSDVTVLRSIVIRGNIGVLGKRREHEFALLEIKRDQKILKYVGPQEPRLIGNVGFARNFDHAVFELNSTNIDLVGPANVTCNRSLITDTSDKCVGDLHHSCLVSEFEANGDSAGPGVQQQCRSSPTIELHINSKALGNHSGALIDSSILQGATVEKQLEFRT